MDNKNLPGCMLLVLRARDGESLADLLPFAQPGAQVAIGRGVAVICAAEALPGSKGATVATMAQISATTAQLRQELAVEDEFSDPYQALLIWKKRATELQVKLMEAEGVATRLALSMQGETRMGEPYIPEEGQEMRGAGPGADLLLAVEKIVREVIQREAVCGGIIARAVAEARP